MSFADLKKRSKLGDLTAKLSKEVEKLNKGGGGGADERLWKPEVDKAGNGYSVIRFLPAPEGEDLPWAKVWNHAFQGTGGWFIENCLTTNGGQCPVCEDNRDLWNSGVESNKDIVRERKRKLSYYANIYVVKDTTNPDNEGKVFLYKFGKKIFDKISAAMQPEFEDEQPIDPFDFWGGANFKLKIKKVAGYWNYDSSEFDRPGPLLDDDEAMEAIWKKQYSLEEFTAAKNFKTYEELRGRIDAVLKTAKPPKRDAEEIDEEMENFRQARETTAPVDTETFSSQPKQTEAATSDDDDLAFFQNLVDL